MQKKKLKTFCFACFYVAVVCMCWWWAVNPQPVQKGPSLPGIVYDQVEHTTLDCDKNVNTMFVLALSYWEHLTMAMSNLFSLVHVAKEWGAHSVFPFSHQSQLFGLPLPERSAFNMLFDTDEINTQLLCKNYGLPSLADFTDFARMANRRIVFVRVAWNERELGVDSRHKKVFECPKVSSHEAGSKFLRTLNNEAKKLGVSEFSIVDYCCVNPHVALNTKEIAELCNFVNTTSTVVVDHWRGHRDQVQSNNPFRMMLPGLKLSHQPHVSKDVFPCSKNIRSNATAFTQSFSERKDFIAIHLHTGRVGHRGQKYVDDCMEEVFALHDNLTELYPELFIKYFVDYGKHGVQNVAEQRKRKPVIEHIEDNKIVPLHYDPAQFGGLSDEGFVSLVEKNAIAKAKVVVLVGGGSFQMQVVQKAKLEPKSKKIYCICDTSGG